MIFKIILCNQLESRLQDARVHCVVLKVRAVPHPATPHGGNQKRPRVTKCFQPEGQSASGPSGPNSVQAPVPSPRSFQQPKLRTRPEIRSRCHVKCSTHELPAKNVCLRSGFWTPKSQMLLRKEVIQPHLPVRLPCYDLVLITDPTFDGSLHKG